METSYPKAFAGCNYTISDDDLCTLDTCCLAQSSFLYRPSFGGNLFFTIFFAISTLPQLWLGIRHKTWGFMVGMILGLICEVVGYAARIHLHIDPFSNGAFLLYLIMLTIAPVFLTAAIYLCLSRIIVIHGTHLAPLKPRAVSLLFMCSDFLSLVLQAAGGAIAETSTSDGDSGRSGIDIMIAGLLLQAISLVSFIGMWAWFQLRVRTRSGMEDQDAGKLSKRSRTAFKLFQGGLLLATTSIIIRSIYRVAELWGGFSGNLWNDEIDFMILDGAMIALAVVVLTALHPGTALGKQWHTANWSFTSKHRAGAKAEREPEAMQRL